ncbi:early nodulin-like protein 1 [Brachypodium distachyon]|uniref:Phytocyanin domain-containing protein n=1 Tax=Brachypodium distachyon TaxID=15368 RepID=A0A2K2DP48_BRADI|nr:early nodulin-like protein 1 [Brachypodium distachyon]PNT76052.1 hypothetical protein BRADI_1g43451v3 [Brachypodium distachyon]|eukprot:XP_024310941.1 early nodulin-like protein 1 [Brachypodium distachyon]
MARVLLSTVVACALVIAGAVADSASPHVFTVGGEQRGWRQPAASDAETYNHWATRNRFHVGDLLYFRYATNDSVLVVSREDYKLCSAEKPALRLEGGEGRFRLERSGFLYFISGSPGHCDAGQRLTVRVMARERDDDDDQHGASSPTAAAPALSPGAAFNSTTPGGSGAVLRPPGGKAGDGKTSGVHAPLVGHRHAVGVALGAAMMLYVA